MLFAGSSKTAIERGAPAFATSPGSEGGTVELCTTGSRTAILRKLSSSQEQALIVQAERVYYTYCPFV